MKSHGCWRFPADKETPVTRPHIFDSHLDVANRWVKELADNLDLGREDYPRVLHALRAGLHAIRDRLPNNEVVDLGAQLPTLIRGFYYEGWTLQRDTKQLRDRAAMIVRVKKELAPDLRLDAVDVLRGVIHLLVEHVSEGEIQDVLATLPKPIRALWHDLTGHVLVASPPSPSPPPRRETLTRRTGYSR
jgi:uncharacterized protein (DUF2267 family)